jgi:hypothetical protein
VSQSATLPLKIDLAAFGKWSRHQGQRTRPTGEKNREFDSGKDLPSNIRQQDATNNFSKLQSFHDFPSFFSISQQNQQINQTPHHFQ